MKYPIAENCLRYEKITNRQYLVINYLTEVEYTIGEDVVNVMRQLDGKTDPKRIVSAFSEWEIEDLLEKLEELGLLRHSRIIGNRKGVHYITLFIPKWTSFEKKAARIYNAIVQWLWFPFLLCGLFIAKMVQHQSESFLFLAIIIWGASILISVIHEFAHAAAGISYGTEVGEIGVIFWYFIYKGAYVLVDAKRVKKAINKVRIDAAGIEAQFFFGGLLFLLAYAVTPLTNIFYYAALTFVSIGLYNMLTIGELDGYHILTSAFGDPQLKRRAKAVLKRKSLRKKQWKRGLPGAITLAACCYFYIQPVFLAIIYLIFLWEYV